MIEGLKSWWNGRKKTVPPPLDRSVGPTLLNLDLSGDPPLEAEPPPAPEPKPQPQPETVKVEPVTDQFPTDQEFEPAEPKARWHIGLLSTKELKEFFELPHFGQGRQAGSLYKTSEAMAEGRQDIVTRFCFVLFRTIERKKVHIDRLNMLAGQVQGVSASSSAQIVTRIKQLEADVATMTEQISLSESHNGWVATALTQYETGFRRGLVDALAMESLL